MCWPKVETPQPSAQESAILDQILAQITEQEAWQETMMPIYAHQMHYKLVETETGKPFEYTEEQRSVLYRHEELGKKIAELRPIVEKYPHDISEHTKLLEYEHEFEELTKEVDIIREQEATWEAATETEWVKMTDEEWYNDPATTDTERKQWDLYQAQLGRQEKALAGEIPLTQAMTDQKQREFDQLKAAFPNISGDTPETAVGEDTIANQNLSEFKRRWGLTEEAARYGEITTGMQNLMGMTGITSDLAQREVSGLMNIGGQQRAMMPQYMSLLQPYQQYNIAGYEAQAQNLAYQQQMMGSLLGAGATAATTAAWLMSGRKYKRDIERKTVKDENKALRDIRKTKSYEYQYKPLLYDNERHLGSIAEESPDSITNKEKTMVNLGDKLELVGMGVKALARKVDNIERRVS